MRVEADMGAGWKAGTVEDGDGLAGKLADVFEEDIDGFDRDKGAESLNAIARAVIEYLLDEQNVTSDDGAIITIEAAP